MDSVLNQVSQKLCVHQRILYKFFCQTLFKTESISCEHKFFCKTSCKLIANLNKIVQIMEFSLGWQGFSFGFPSGLTLPALRKPPQAPQTPQTPQAPQTPLAFQNSQPHQAPRAHPTLPPTLPNYHPAQKSLVHLEYLSHNFLSVLLILCYHLVQPKTEH